MTLKALPLPSPIDIKVNKYFRKRQAHDKFDQLFEDINYLSNFNISLNFKMPVFRILGLNYRND